MIFSPVELPHFLQVFDLSIDIPNVRKSKDPLTPASPQRGEELCIDSLYWTDYGVLRLFPFHRSLMRD